MSPRTYNLALIGFGNVGRTFVSLLARKSERLEAEHGVRCTITGVASRRLGWLANPEGFHPARLLAGDLQAAIETDSIQQWLDAARPDAVFEITSLNATSGEPAIQHLKSALEHGAHGISANKGPVVYAYDELTALAAQKGRKFYFESSVMDGAPVFNLFRECLPVIEVQGFRGILNSTTNVILEAIEQGKSFEEAVRYAQQIGVAETDPANDIDGWDAAVKVCAIARVLMGQPLRPDQVERVGIREITREQIEEARGQNRRYKLVCAAHLQGNSLVARATPEAIKADDPLAQVSGTSSLVCFETDMLPGLAIHEINPGLDAVAYGLLTDFLRAIKE